jgi:hypothetical protein
MEATKPPVIACNLGALSAAERERRAALAGALVPQARSIQELPDGYALQLSVTPSLAHEALEWLLLERRCCPFLRLELELESEEGPLWLRLRGGPGVKEFLSAAGLAGRLAASCGCR